MIQLHLCDYSDSYIVVKGKTIIKGVNNVDRLNRSLAFKHNATFISCATKINNALFGNTEDLDIVMHMYNLIEYTKN